MAVLMIAEIPGVTTGDYDALNESMNIHGDTDAVLAIGGKPGEPYSPSAWEWYFYAERFRPSRDWDGAVAELTEGVQRHPEHAAMLYSLACYEALAGHHGDALAHLARAVELDPSMKPDVEKDADFDSIRALPGFPV